MDNEQHRVAVWDPFIRIFHWSLALTLVLAWVSAEQSLLLHEQAGYFIMALIGLRMIWGIIGSRHARFSDFVVSPKQTIDYMQSMLSGKPERYTGHNPAGGWMVIALLLSLIATAVTGMMMTDASLVFYESIWEEWHEAMASLTLLLIFVHIAGVLLTSQLHDENLAKAMLTGKKTKRQDNV